VLRLVQFLKIYILQDSVATRFGCDGIYNNNFIANFSQSVPVKEFWKSVQNWQSYRYISLVYQFSSEHSVYHVSSVGQKQVMSTRVHVRYKNINKKSELTLKRRATASV